MTMPSFVKCDQGIPGTPVEGPEAVTGRIRHLTLKTQLTHASNTQLGEASGAPRPRRIYTMTGSQRMRQLASTGRFGEWRSERQRTHGQFENDERYLVGTLSKSRPRNSLLARAGINNMARLF